MAKILRCPECGAGEDELYAEQDVIAVYSVRANPSAQDGIETFDETLQGDKYSWRMGCGQCGAEDEPSTEPFGGRWLMEVDEIDQDRLSCTICGDSVAESNLRDHLELHAGDARGWDYQQVRDAYRAEE